MSRPYQQISQQDSVNANDPPSNTPESFLNKSWHICTVFGIPVHIHVWLPLFFVLSFFFWIRIFQADPQSFWFIVFLIVINNLVLWITVFIHEMGHCYAGYLIGGSTDKVLLWPLGGLAYTAPPYNPSRYNFIQIALGGPLTHIPSMIFWGALIMYFFDSEVFSYGMFWKETVFVPMNIYRNLLYNVLMLSFTMNFWLFVVNLFVPAFPLDGGRVFVNFIRQYVTTRRAAEIYVGANAVMGVFFVVLSYVVLQSGSMTQFAGFWAVIESYQMVQLMSQGREYSHPLFLEGN